MDKYMQEFKSYLNQLSDHEFSEVVDFYMEYLQDGGFETYEACVAELGTPKQLARKVLADYSIRLLDAPEKEKTTMRSRVQQSTTQVHTIWLIVLAILSTPLTIPLGIAVLATLFAVFVAGAAIVFSIVVTIIALLFAAVVVLGIGIAIIGQSLSTGLFYIGGAIASLGLFLICVPVINWFIRGVIHATLSFSQWLYSKLNRKNRAEERRDQK